MKNKSLRMYTIGYILQLLSLWVIFAMNCKLQIVSNAAAFIIIAVCIVLQTLIWRFYIYKEDRMNFAIKEIIRALPAAALIEIINERSDIQAGLVESEQAKEPAQ